jgi:hypothetical protein
MGINPLYAEQGKLSSNIKPLYDGTNYTFPDTTTPAGIAELLECTFVHGCMQLASGYIDVLKLFVAASVAAYEFGFSICDIQKELEICSKNTANRPLMAEEIQLRRTWLCVIYLTLNAMGHKTMTETIPNDILQEYGTFAGRVAKAYKQQQNIPSVEELLRSSVDSVGNDNNKNVNTLSPMEKAILSQSLRVSTLTPVVIQEASLARGDDNGDDGNEATPRSIDPPRPPIEGAFPPSKKNKPENDHDKVAFSSASIDLASRQRMGARHRNIAMLRGLSDVWKNLLRHIIRFCKSQCYKKDIGVPYRREAAAEGSKLRTKMVALMCSWVLFFGVTTMPDSFLSYRHKQSSTIPQQVVVVVQRQQQQQQQHQRTNHQYCGSLPVVAGYFIWLWSEQQRKLQQIPDAAISYHLENNDVYPYTLKDVLDHLKMRGAYQH